MENEALLGQVLGDRYHLQARLGQGGMGCVYRAWHLHLERAVAVKVLHLPIGSSSERADFVRRFRREAQVASGLLHPHIARVLDFGVEGEMPYMVLDLVEGDDLAALIRAEAPVPPLRAIEILRQLLLALDAAARHHIVHRDIKPSNLRLAAYQTGGPIDLRVLDFGLAKRWDDQHEPLTASGTILGTLAYMAPEQVSAREVERAHAPAHSPGGSAQVDGRADLYAAGVVLYELLTGATPFVGAAPALVYAHLYSPPQPLPGHLPAELRALTAQLLHKHPDGRPASAAAALALLGACSAALAPPTVTTAARGSWRGRVTPAKVLSFVMPVLLCGVTLSLAFHRLAQHRAAPSSARLASAAPNPSAAPIAPPTPSAAPRPSAAPIPAPAPRAPPAPTAAQGAPLLSTAPRAQVAPARKGPAPPPPPIPEYWTELGPGGLPVLRFGHRADPQPPADARPAGASTAPRRAAAP